jgi:hypothetical protein
VFDKRKTSWSNPAHQKRLDEFYSEDSCNKQELMENLSNNMENIQSALQAPENYKNFFWTPDLNIYGFAQKGQIIETMDQWNKV